MPRLGWRSYLWCLVGDVVGDGIAWLLVRHEFHAPYTLVSLAVGAVVGTVVGKYSMTVSARRVGIYVKPDRLERAFMRWQARRLERSLR